MEPGNEAVKTTADKTKAELGDKNVNSSFTFRKPFPEVKAATSARLGGASQTLKIISRLELIEKALFSLQDSKQKTEDDISEIKQWRDNLQTEKNNMAEQFCNQQKQNLESLRQKIREQDDKIKELNKEIESLKEKEAQSNKTLEKLSLKIKEYENNLNPINQEMELKTDSLTQEVRIHCSLVSSIQDQLQENMLHTTCNLNELYAKFENQAKDVLKLENQLKDVLKLENQVKDVLKLENQVKDVLKLENQVKDVLKLENQVKDVLKLGNQAKDVLKLENQVQDVLKRENQVQDVLKLENQVKDVLKLENQLKDVLKLENQVKDVLKLGNQVKDVLKLENQVKDVLKLENQVQDVLKLENQVKDVLKLSTPLNTVKSPSCKPYICQVHVDSNTPVTRGSIVSTFYNVWERNGCHFNQTTGKLVAPEDGIYLVIATLLEYENKLIQVNVLIGEVLCNEVFVTTALTSACGSTVVSIKKGGELFFQVAQADAGAKLQRGSGFTIVRL
ncbi:nuclease SbcCD subunit C-like isoform X2 [Physella acuta]|uniref:nuclease SbcCD subunit C-like isoform X2 n=1 Tax=Physella acuta TaxID=109671 RepID=UPI0027DB640B|nr:nuclease SbcCD subunit C-like isoform X2 [Physella acuta]